MKKFHFTAICGILAVLFAAGCGAPDGIMLSNSMGYDYNKQTEANSLLRDKRPEWFGDNWYKWREEKEKDGVTLYFLGISEPSFVELKKKGIHSWSDEDGIAQTLNNVWQELTNNIAAKIKATSKKNKTEQYKIITEQKQLVERLREFDRYTEKWEYKDKKNDIFAVRCWVVYSISQVDVNKVRQMVHVDENERIRDENEKQENFEQREEEYYKILSRQYEEVIKDLNYNLSRDEKQFEVKYNELLEIHAKLQTLSTVKARNDKLGQEYKELMEKIGGEIRAYNSVIKQNRLLKKLERNMAEIEDDIKNQTAE